MKNKVKIIKVSEFFSLKEFDKTKDLKNFSDFIYHETIKLEEDKEVHYNGSLKDLYRSIKDLHKDYPGFREWYFEKVSKNLLNGTREILLCFCVDEKTSALELSGIAILKKTEKEKKICTFRISPKYRGNGIAKDLFEKSFEILGTKKPLITISEKRKKDFEKYIKMFEFVQTECLLGKYRKNNIEYVYNGRLD